MVFRMGFVFLVLFGLALAGLVFWRLFTQVPVFTYARVTGAGVIALVASLVIYLLEVQG